MNWLFSAEKVDFDLIAEINIFSYLLEKRTGLSFNFIMF